MQNIRNIAIIAHVDHGKTTLVDKIIHATNIFRENQESGELIMDNNDLERERGITILSKNISVTYKDTKINVIDTPGHADFGGEVERVLKMADGVILLVDAFEGPMPQTRFVLQKALELGLRPLVVINKVDKPNCRPEEVHDQVFDLFFNLEATEEQLDFPTFYGSSKQGWFNTSLEETENIFPLLDGILQYVPEPKVEEGNLQMQIVSLDFSSFLGRIAIGKVIRGEIKESMWIGLAQADGKVVKGKEVAQTFLPVFWNTSWFKMRPPHTLGIVVDPKHPAFAEFPTAYHSDMQWWEIVNKTQVMNLEDFPKGFKPIIQPIDTWFLNRRLAMVFEAKVGNGKLVVSSANLASDLKGMPSASQLYYSLQKYMNSDLFNPKHQIAFETIKDLFETPSKQQFETFTKDAPDELKTKTKTN